MESLLLKKEGDFAGDISTAVGVLTNIFALAKASNENYAVERILKQHFL